MRSAYASAVSEDRAASAGVNKHIAPTLARVVPTFARVRARNGLVGARSPFSGAVSISRGGGVDLVGPKSPRPLFGVNMLSRVRPMSCVVLPIAGAPGASRAGKLPAIRRCARYGALVTMPRDGGQTRRLQVRLFKQRTTFGSVASLAEMGVSGLVSSRGKNDMAQTRDGGSHKGRRSRPTRLLTPALWPPPPSRVGPDPLDLTPPDRHTR